MVLKDLQVGWAVKTRNGQLFIVSPYKSTIYDYEKVLISLNTNDDTWLPLDYFDYSQDMICRAAHDYDIVKVYGYASKPNLALAPTTTGRQVIWKEDQPKEMTLEEIEHELGHKVKIVKGEKKKWFLKWR